MTDNSQATPAPWYRQFWPWFLISIPAITIVYCAFFITTALRMDDGLVSDSYYKSGLVYKEQLALEQRAAELGLTLGLNMTDSGKVHARLSGAEVGQFPQLVLNLSHPTLQQEDRRLVLQKLAPGRYVAQLNRPLPRLPAALKGGWQVEVTPLDRSWRLHTRSDLVTPVDLSLRPDPTP